MAAWDNPFPCPDRSSGMAIKIVLDCLDTARRERDYFGVRVFP